jgi:hypothetical protein
LRWTDLPVILGAALMSCCAPPAMARTDTKLVHCRPQSCLLVSGHRDNPASIVLINGHAVSVKGGRHWQIRMPVETLRAWSAPLARQIAITTIDARGGTPTLQQADLPIGLLGHADLALLVAAPR